MTEQEQQRLANLEVAVMAILAHLTGSEMDLERVSRELYDCGKELGAFRAPLIAHPDIRGRRI